MRQIDFAALINSLRNDTDVSFLLGAGCSVSSGCLSAQGLVRLFKTELYCADSGCLREDVTSFDETKFQALVNERYVNNTKESDYSYFFQKAFPIPQDRDIFIKERFQNKSPSAGYLYFADYLIRNAVKVVYTTNFDSLVKKAVHKLDENYDISLFADEMVPHLNSKLCVVELHGDYGYTFTKNTEEELASLSLNCQKRLMACTTHKIVILGYSGSDQSVMSALNELLDANPMIHLVWCMYGNAVNELNPKVKDLLKRKNTTLAVGISFDELFERLYISGSNPRLEGLVEPQSPVLKWRARKTARENLITNLFQATALPDIFVSADNENQNDENADDFVVFRNKRYSLRCFPSCISASFEASDLNPNLKKKLIKQRILQVAKQNGKEVVQDNVSFRQNGNGICFGLHVGIVTSSNKLYLALHPKYFYQDGHSPSLNEFLLIAQKTRSLYANKLYDALRQMIAGLFPTGLSFPQSGNPLTFSNEPISLLAKDNKTSVIREPIMEVDGAHSVNQISLLSQHGPISAERLGQKDINICVLSLPAKKRALYDGIIQELCYGNTNTPSSPNSIIPKYEGFEALFHIPLVITKTSVDIQECDFIGQTFERFLDIMAKKVMQVYDAASRKPDVILVHFTKEMSALRGGAQYDFHDMLKLRLIGKCKTQIIEESTLTSPDDKNKILFNLATAIYTKSIGMPWRPLRFEKNKFFMGMAFGLSHRGVNVSCSQLFDGSGNGMKLIVSPVSGEGKHNSRFQKNPYLTKAEARELGKRMLALHAQSSSPFDIRKIVVHRTTPFTREEIEGFGEAFHGLDDFILLQIQESVQAFSYVMNGEKTISGYPPLRGTVVQWNDKEILFWTDGSVRDAAVRREGKTYRNSASGTAGPILVRIFHGNVSIEEVCEDIMYLTKMDFNSSDVLFSRLPVSIKYAKKLARMLKYSDDNDFSGEIDFRYIM